MRKIQEYILKLKSRLKENRATRKSLQIIWMRNKREMGKVEANWQI